MERLENTLLEILRIESVTGKEKALCDYMEARITGAAKAGRLGRFEDSLVLCGPRVEGRPTVCLAGHLDTVPGKGFGEDARIEADRIVGLGASDMKGGVAVMLELLEGGLLARSRFNIVQVYYSGEEGPHDRNAIHGLLASVEELKTVDLCFILEPTDLTLHLGCMGVLQGIVSFKGKRAHSARPWLGSNAIHKAGPLLCRLSAREPRDVAIGDLVFREVVSATIASGGTARNVVPDKFDMNLNMRFAPGRSIEEARDDMKQLVADEGEIFFTDRAPACPVPADNPILTEFRERYRLAEHPKQAYTDVAAFHGAGVPAVNFGPGLTEQAHKEGEYLLKDDLFRTYEIYRQFLCE